MRALQLFAVAVALLPALVPAALRAEPASPAASALLRLAAQPVDDATLAQARGGSGLTSAGLAISLAIRREVQIGSAAGEAIGTGIGSGVDLAALTVVQRGSGNAVVASNLGAAGAATLLQNTLDNQHIRAVTTIDVQASSLQAWRASALQATLGNAITASLRR